MWLHSSSFSTKLSLELHISIIQYLSLPSDIYAMALTSRSLLSPALDHLWYEVDFYCIVASLPVELFNIVVDGKMKHYFLKPNRVIFPEDLARFLKHYAPRIRTIRRYSHACHSIDPKVFAALQLATYGQLGALTPNLQNFGWRLGDSIDILKEDSADEDSHPDPSAQYLEGISPYLNLFVGPTVTSLAFELYEAGDFPVSRAAMFMAAKRLSSTLDCLVIDGCPTSENPVNSFLKPFRWSNLTHLYLSHILHPTRDIPYLGSLPKLECLTIKDVPGRSDQESTPTGGSAPSASGDTVTKTPGFLALETVEIWAAYDTPWTELVPLFLEHLSPQNVLTSFSYYGGVSMSAGEAEEMFEALTHSLNPNALQYLFIQDQGFYTVPHEDSIDYDPLFRRAASISQLSSFKNLRELKISLTDGVRITPADIQGLAGAWPQLTVLDLCPTTMPAHSPWIDHYQLVDLAVACPKLSIIGVPFDATKVDGNEDLALLKVSGLQVMHTWGSTLVCPTQVAAFLRRTFPRLMTLDHNCPSALEGTNMKIMLDWERWCKVGDMMWSDL